MALGLYSEAAKSYNELHETEQLRKLHIIKSELNMGETAKVLDVGCGTGLSKMLGCHITGIDSSPEMLKKAEFDVVLGNAEQLPFDDESFDAVICISAIHNFEDYQKAIKEMMRVSGGKLVISVLKASKKAAAIEAAVNTLLTVQKIISEPKDRIFFCTK